MQRKDTMPLIFKVNASWLKISAVVHSGHKSPTPGVSFSAQQQQLASCIWQAISSAVDLSTLPCHYTNDSIQTDINNIHLVVSIARRLSTTTAKTRFAIPKLAITAKIKDWKIIDLHNNISILNSRYKWLTIHTL